MVATVMMGVLVDCHCVNGLPLRWWVGRWVATLMMCMIVGCHWDGGPGGELPLWWWGWRWVTIVMTGVAVGCHWCQWRWVAAVMKGVAVGCHCDAGLPLCWWMWPWVTTVVQFRVEQFHRVFEWCSMWAVLMVLDVSGVDDWNNFYSLVFKLNCDILNLFLYVYFWWTFIC